MTVSIGTSSQATAGLFSINNTAIPLRLHTELLGLPSFEANLSTTLTNKSEPETMQQIARWPFYAYLAGTMFCLLVSSACHLLSCHSEHTCYIMLTCDPIFGNLYMGFITVFGRASVFVSLVPVFERPEFRIVRTGLFACMGLSGLVPIMHKMVAFGDRPEAVITTAYENVMLCFYGVGVIVYALRTPERWLPGKFDLIGHCHQ